MKALKLELSIAKAKHAAYKSPCLAPHALELHAAKQWLEKYAPQARKLDQEPERDQAGDITRDQLQQRRQVLADRDAVLAYRKEKQRLHDAVIAVQEKILAAQTASDLE